MKKIIFFAIIALLLAACKDEIPPEVPEKPKNMEFYNARWAMEYKVPAQWWVSGDGYTIREDTIIANKDGTLSEGRKVPILFVDGTWGYGSDSSTIAISYMRSGWTNITVNYEIDSLTHFGIRSYIHNNQSALEVRGKRIEDF